jgi:hypothetical protein
LGWRAGFWRGSDGRGVRWRSRDNECGAGWRRGLDGGLGLLALEDRPEGVTRLRDLGEVELRLVVHSRPVRTCRAAAGLEVAAHLLGFIGVDRAGVSERLVLRDAQCCQRVQDRLGLHF